METIELETRTRYQTIEGFGASGAWWAQHVGGWEENVREHVVRMLLDREKGIGLSIYRYNIGAGSEKEITNPWTRTESFEVARGVCDWSRDRNAVWVLKAAHAAGVERFVVFVNSPPGRMTCSGRADGATDHAIRAIDDLSACLQVIFHLLLGKKTMVAEGYSNLRYDMVDDFAQYLVDVVRHLQEDEGVPIG